MCKHCGSPILSNSFAGQPVKLFLLKDGEVIEQMEGEYDSYGRIFNENKESIQWKMEWGDVCDLMFHKNKNNGIAAIHSSCYQEDIPNERSKDDPNQGWGDDDELMGNFDPEFEFD